VFVAPPSLEDLAKRLHGRGTEESDHIRRRLAAAKAEINRCARGRKGPVGWGGRLMAASHRQRGGGLACLALVAARSQAGASASARGGCCCPPQHRLHEQQQQRTSTCPASRAARQADPPPSPAPPAPIYSVNERGLYDYLIINDNLDDAVDKLRAVAMRALQGLDPEPGKMPESVLIEDVSGAPLAAHAIIIGFQSSNLHQETE